MKVAPQHLMSVSHRPLTLLMHNCEIPLILEAWCADAFPFKWGSPRLRLDVAVEAKLHRRYVRSHDARHFAQGSSVLLDPRQPEVELFCRQVDGKRPPGQVPTDWRWTIGNPKAPRLLEPSPAVPGREFEDSLTPLLVLVRIEFLRVNKTTVSVICKFYPTSTTLEPCS
jgi:hypothetical protein